MTNNAHESGQEAGAVDKRNETMAIADDSGKEVGDGESHPSKPAKEVNVVNGGGAAKKESDIQTGRKVTWAAEVKQRDAEAILRSQLELFERQILASSGCVSGSTVRSHLQKLEDKVSLDNRVSGPAEAKSATTKNSPIIHSDLQMLEKKVAGSGKVSSSASDLRSNLEMLETKLASGVVSSNIAGLRSNLENLESKAMGSATVSSSDSKLRSHLERLETKLASSGAVSASATDVRSNLENLESKAMGSFMAASSGSELQSHLERLETKLAASGAVSASATDVRSNLENLESKAMGSAMAASSGSELQSHLERLETKLAASGAVSASATDVRSNLENLESKAMGSAMVASSGSELQSHLERLERKAVGSTESVPSYGSGPHLTLQTLEDDVEASEVKRLERRLVAGALIADANSTPGAYCEVPTQEEQINRLERQHWALEDIPEVAPVNVSAETDLTENEIACNGLVEAKPVLDANNLEIGVAFPSKSKASESNTSNSKLQHWAIWSGLFFCFVIVVVVVTVALAVRKAGNHGEMEGVIREEPTGMPTIAPTPSPTPYAVELPDFTLQALKDPESPQLKAYRWLQDDPMLESYSDSKRLQRMALATFYHATMGDNWTVNRSWMSYKIDECQWFSKFNVVGEDEGWAPNKPFQSGHLAGEAVCDDAGNYLELALPSNGLLGTIPEEIVFLSTLERIELSRNELVGQLTTGLGSLTRLRELSITTSEMTGTVPTEFGQMSALEYLTMSRWKVTGTLPSELGNMASLERLVIPVSELTGSIPSEISMIRNLTDLGTFLCCFFILK